MRKLRRSVHSVVMRIYFPITKNLNNINIETLITISISALIAGLMVFFKALMKAKALKNANRIILKLGIILEKTIYSEKKLKKDKKF